MSTRAAVFPAAREVPSLRITETLLILSVACLAVLTVAFLNQPWFDLVSGLIPVDGPVASGLLFSSWLLLIGLPIVIRQPRDYGFTFGAISEHWRLVAGVLVSGAVLTASILVAIGPVPYSGAAWFIEIVDVPITEELVFRAVLLTALLGTLGRIHAPRTAVLLAIVFDGLAFGIGHLANAATLELGFVLPQVAFASVLGMGCAFLMVRTQSVYPAILLHAVVNGVVVAF